MSTLILNTLQIELFLKHAKGFKAIYILASYSKADPDRYVRNFPLHKSAFLESLTGSMKAIAISYSYFDDDPRYVFIDEIFTTRMQALQDAAAEKAKPVAYENQVDKNDKK